MNTKLLEQLRTPCGRTTGHGDHCARGWECGACAEKVRAAAYIEKLETELKALKESK